MNSVTPSFRELKVILKPMSWKARLDYLWTYYKIVPILFVCLLAVISVVVTSIQNSKIESLHSGVLFGVTVSEEASGVLSDDLLAYFEGDGEERVVYCNSFTYMEGNDPAYLEVNQASSMQLVASLAARELDYVIFTAGTYKNYVHPDGYYEDLRRVLTAEQLEELSDLLVWTEKYEDIESYPVALDISGTEFAKHCNRVGEELYLVIPIANPNLERTPLFIDYLLNWKP